ncbi:histidine phosphatase family protein [Paenibacillus sp. 598K]|nr:histidine phosphatase family protein [Paenibacillus sp. 598K]
MVDREIKIVDTMIYFVRHAESPFVAGMERERGLSETGRHHAMQVKDVLRIETIDHILSSPYERAIQTVKPLADELQKDIVSYEDLRERELGSIGEMRFEAAKRKLYADFDYHYDAGESSFRARERAVRILDNILQAYEGQGIVIGTHGDIMTLMMSHYDDRYGIAFWESTSMPDIYRLAFQGNQLKDVKRLWQSSTERNDSN